MENYSSLNLTDINIFLENFFRDLLNLVLRGDFQNINFYEKNAVAIDLVDKTAKIAVQITSTNDFAKIKETVTKFNEHKLYKTYNKLKILIIGQKRDYRKKKIGDPSKQEIDIEQDVWDISSLIKLINDKDQSEIQLIRQFLAKEITIAPKNHVSKEVSTFQTLILLLSNEEHPGIGAGFIEKPDPNRKINVNFTFFGYIFNFFSFNTRSYIFKFIFILIIVYFVNKHSG